MPQPRRNETTSDRRKTFRFSDDEVLKMQRAAAANFQSMSAFARDAIVTAASETLDRDDSDEAEPSDASQ